MEGSKNYYPVLSLGVTTRLLKRTAIVLLLSVALCLATLRFVSLVEAAKIIPDTSPTAIRTAKIDTPATATPPPTVSPAASTPTITPNCTPFGAIPVPGSIPLTSPGLLQQIDTPQTYTVYGNDSNEVARQLQRCLPSGQGGSFSGATSYWIGNQYSYTVTPDAKCRLSNIAVGIHITQVLPAWKNTGNAALSSKWQAYEHNLTLHENGHVVINITEAQALLSDLQNMPAMPCDQIAATANNITNNHIAALNAANNNYDYQTGHGTRQGATW